MMNCSLCKNGEMKPGSTTLTLERNGAVVVIRETPALICDQCGDTLFAEDVTGVALQLAEEAVRRGVQVEVISFAAHRQQAAA